MALITPGMVHATGGRKINVQTEKMISLPKPPTLRNFNWGPISHNDIVSSADANLASRVFE